MIQSVLRFCPFFATWCLIYKQQDIRNGQQVHSVSIYRLARMWEVKTCPFLVPLCLGFRFDANEIPIFLYTFRFLWYLRPFSYSIHFLSLFFCCHDGSSGISHEHQSLFHLLFEEKSVFDVLRSKKIKSNRFYLPFHLRYTLRVA